MLFKIPTVKYKTLALAGHHKAGFCFACGDDAFICDHEFDLSTEKGVSDLRQVMDKCLSPDVLVSDMHPDLASTVIAKEMAKRLHIPHIQVRHHHAHIAAVMAEYDVNIPVLGMALDGLGYGENGELWGGELLKVANCSYQRLGRLKPIRLPGADVATMETWRIAVAFLYDKVGFLPDKLPPLFKVALEKHINTPYTSSCGRLFDLAMALTGLKDLHTFEQNATKPEVLQNGFSVTKKPNGLFEADVSQMLLHIFKEPQNAANYFHGTLAKALADMASMVKDETGINTIALAGGCLLNNVLKSQLKDILSSAGFVVLVPSVLPPGDKAVPFGMVRIATTYGY